MKTRKTAALAILLLWAVLTAATWMLPAGDISEAERRPLAQFPKITGKSLANGSFMADFEEYTLDQFPLRDRFRTAKSLFHQYLLGQSDNNGIYLAEGYAVRQEYPLNISSLDHAVSRFTRVYEKYLADSRIFMAIVPDKGQYLAEKSGHLALDMEQMMAYFAENMPWATQIDLRDVLSAEDYYRTDTHWRQENLFDAAKTLCDALSVAAPDPADYTQTPIDRPFYGVYYGQSALPLPPETLYIMESPLLAGCSVYDHESGKTGTVYDATKLNSKDLYDVFLSGSRSLLTVENPAGNPETELIVFRDSFGSSIIPLLLTEYGKVTVVDIRYIQPDLLDRFVEFRGQDVLFLYSTLVLNNSETIK